MKQPVVVQRWPLAGSELVDAGTQGRLVLTLPGRRGRVRIECFIRPGRHGFLIRPIDDDELVAVSAGGGLEIYTRREQPAGAGEEA